MKIGSRLSGGVLSFVTKNHTSLLVSVKVMTKLEVALRYVNFVNFCNVRQYVTNFNRIAKVSTSPSAQEIRSFLQQKNLEATSGPTCFKCKNVFPKSKSVGRPKKESTSNKTLFINKTTGDFFCISSGHSGSWSQFCGFVQNPLTNDQKFENADKKMQPNTEIIEKIWQDSIPLSEVSDLNREETLGKYGLGTVPISDMEMYDIRLNNTLDTIIVPWFSNTNIIGSGKQVAKGIPIGLKTYNLKKGLNASTFQYDVSHYPSKGYYSMLGLSQVSTITKKIVLTMNEFDAIAVNCASSKCKAVSLPYGNTYLPLQILPYLEQFSEIVLWFNNNQVSWEAARQFAKKLGEKRCRLVRPTASTPNPLRALSENLDVDKILSETVSAEVESIVCFNDLRSFVKDELMNCDTVCGVQWSRFPKITEKLKGHRRGELSVLTGPTGSGKTTFMSEYSLDLAMQGVSTLWGSFEIQNVRLLKTMMKQFARTKLETNMSDFDNIANKFQALPIHLMTYNGPQSMKDVIHTMRQAAYVHDIQHIVIDNLQFMMGAMSKNNDRFMVQDMLISEFRNFATTEHIHVTIVIHPRKEDSGLPLQISSIFGTAKATQEADNVIILQRVNHIVDGTSMTKSYIEIAKNRYDGELGRIALYFDKNSLCMSKTPITLEEEVAQNLKPFTNGDAILASSKSNSQSVIQGFESPAWLKEWKSKNK